MEKSGQNLGSDAAFLRRALIVIALGALVLTIWVLSGIILLVFGSVLVAVTLRSLARPLSRYLRLGERWAMAVAGVCVLIVLAVVLMTFGADLSEQMRGLSERLSTVAKTLADRLELGSIADLFKGQSPASNLTAIAAHLFVWSSTLLEAITGLLLVVFGGIYLAMEPQLYKAGFLKLVPSAAQPRIDSALEDAHEVLRHWLGAQLIAMALVGTMTGLGLWVIGLPTPIALGLIAGVAEFIPIVGPVAASVPVLLVAGAQDWETVLWAIGVIVVVQQLESNVITPLVIGRTVAVAPAVALFAIVSMGVLFGPLGLLFGFPLALVFDVAVRRFYVLDTLGERVSIMGRPAKKDR